MSKVSEMIVMYWLMSRLPFRSLKRPPVFTRSSSEEGDRKLLTAETSPAKVVSRAATELSIRDSQESFL